MNQPDHKQIQNDILTANSYYSNKKNIKNKRCGTRNEELPKQQYQGAKAIDQIASRQHKD